MDSEEQCRAAKAQEASLQGASEIDEEEGMIHECDSSSFATANSTPENDDEVNLHGYHGDDETQEDLEEGRIGRPGSDECSLSRPTKRATKEDGSESSGTEQVEVLWDPCALAGTHIDPHQPKNALTSVQSAPPLAEAQTLGEVSILGVGVVVADDDEADENSPSRQRIWERLPVATPVFDAEVEVWDFKRPQRANHFGKGLMGDRDDDSEPKERQPIFSDEDKANPLRCLCKLLGIVLGLPLYLIYQLLIFSWVMPLLRMLDCFIFRPVGLLLDYAVFFALLLIWAVFEWVLVPLYKYLVVYPSRIAWNGVLLFAKYFLIASVCLCEWTLIPVCSLAKKAASFIARSIQEYLLLPCWKAMKAIGGMVSKYLVQPIHYSLLKLWELLLAILAWVGRACTAMGTFAYRNAWLPFCDGVGLVVSCFLQYVVEPVTNGVAWFCETLYSGLACFLRALYMNVAKPFAEGVSCVVKAFYSAVLRPVGSLLLAAVTALWEALSAVASAAWKIVAAVSTAVYENVLRPIGTSLMSLLTAIGSAIVAVFETVGSILSEIVRSVGAAMSAIGSAIGSVFGRISRVFSL